MRSGIKDQELEVLEQVQTDHQLAVEGIMDTIRKLIFNLTTLLVQRLSLKAKLYIAISIM